MKKIALSENWPESWKTSYLYDLLEVYGELSAKGYAYAYANRRKYTLELIKKVAKSDAKILDLAAAQGNFTLLLAELGFEVTWNDLRKDLAEYTKLKYEHGIIHYVPGNIFELDFVESFDVVLITEIIEHVAHPDDFLKQISRMVKRDGHVVMTTPNGGYFLSHLPRFTDCSDATQFEAMQFKPDSDGHIFLLHTDEVSCLAKQAGLIVKEIKLFSNPLTNGHMKLGNLLKILPRTWVDICERFTTSLPFKLRNKVHAGMAVTFARAD
jgi:2-polyprenyl-6-hydroxyphenyl methylase/3-demethylubiquinone-9 3-methyltransferase